MAGEITNLTVVPEMGLALQYQGVSDPRWSSPQTLVWDEVWGRVLPLEAGQTQPPPGQRPATALEVQASFPTASYQRILTGGVGEAPQYFVVNAIYRLPCQADLHSLLPSLPAQLHITSEEMDVLGPWLGLTRDSVCDAGENILDVNFEDNIDHRYQTKYNWNDFLSVTELYAHLKVFKMVKDGLAQNLRNWPTDFNDTRLQDLISQTEARSRELYDQLSHKPSTWEKSVDAVINGAGFGLGMAPITAASAVGGWAAVKLFGRFMAKRAAVAGGAALVDGPVPAGDIVGGGILIFSVGDFMWNYDEIAGELENQE